MPAILIETGFISNPGDEINLAKPVFRDQIAEAIAGGIL
jgi:N-acetylmuramoyl-L-alanine amidase